MQPRTLIIGTSGQLSTELHRQWHSATAQLLPRRKVELADERAIKALLDEQRPTLIINAAAYTAVDRAEQERERAFAVNADGPRFLARWCQANGAVLVHVSTDFVFDGQKPSPYVESDATGPLSVYGSSKLAGEIAVREELERHLVLRTSWVFSAHGHNFVKTIRRLAGEPRPLRVVADQRGRPTSAADLAGAIWRVCGGLLQSSTAQLPWGTYHLANQGATTWHGFAQAIVDLDSSAPKSVEPIPSSAYPSPAARPVNSVLDTELFEMTFGFGLRPFLAALSEVMAELSTASETR
jgi:dTDP-4-dehydrorhamnose reductase